MIPLMKKQLISQLKNHEQIMGSLFLEAVPIVFGKIVLLQKKLNHSKLLLFVLT